MSEYEDLLRHITALQERVAHLERCEYVAAAGKLTVGYAYVPLATSLTNASWDGDAKNTGTYTLTAADFGYPAAAKALAIQLQGQWAAASGAVMYARNPTSGVAVLVGANQANVWETNAGIVSCNANGEFVIVIASANAAGASIQVHGYFI